MSEPSGIEYCVRDRHRTVVVPCRPVEDLLQVAKACIRAQASVTAQAIQNGVTMSGFDTGQATDRLSEAEAHLRALLGLGADHDNR